MNITERATELAHEKTVKYCEENNINWDIAETTDVFQYTDKAQKIFDDYYDNIHSILQTKQIRMNLDMLVRDIEDLGKSRPASIAITNVEQAIMWLGKHLAELGAANPYPESKNPINDSVEPTADTYVSLGKVDYVELPNPKDLHFYYVVNGLKYRYLGENSKGLNLAISDDNKELLTFKEGDIVDKLIFTNTIPVAFDLSKPK